MELLVRKRSIPHIYIPGSTLFFVADPAMERPRRREKSVVLLNRPVFSTYVETTVQEGTLLVCPQIV